MLKVTVYDKDFASEEDLEFDVDFVSMVNAETHGPPALVAPFKGTPPTAREGDSVLYINTALVPMFKIDRVGD